MDIAFSGSAQNANISHSGVEHGFQRFQSCFWGFPGALELAEWVEGRLKKTSACAQTQIERILSYSFISPKGGCHKIERKKKKDICVGWPVFSLQVEGSCQAHGETTRKISTALTLSTHDACCCRNTTSYYGHTLLLLS